MFVLRFMVPYSIQKITEKISLYSSLYLLTAAFVTTRTDSFDKNALGSPQLFIIVRTLLVGSKRSSDFSTIFALEIRYNYNFTNN